MEWFWNPIFNECKRVNIIYSIFDDLTVNSSVYNDIENFLWANKQEPISEPDNKTKNYKSWIWFKNII